MLDEFDYILSECKLCGRNCGVNRNQGKKGFCGCDDKLLVARAALHPWEEPVISGENGSGTVFFSGCSLGCVFCQNHNIATRVVGKEISIDRLVEIFFELKEKGAHNINLVTPTHYIPHIVKALKIAKDRGLNLPIVYNTSSYENVESLKLLEGLVDIYLPDCKYYDSQLSKKYSGALDYYEVASKAIAEMFRQVGEPVFDGDLLMKGVVIRHLIMPGCIEDSKKIIKNLYNVYANRVYYSIMNQYTPLEWIKDYPEINRKLTDEEYDEVVDYAIDLGVENGFIQEGETASESFIPEFDCGGV